MTTLTRTTIASVILALSVAACGGGSGGVAPSAPGKTVSSNGLTASAVFVVKVPHESTTTSGARKPQYLTPQVQGIDFSVYANDGSAVNNRGYVFYALTPQSTYCTDSESALTCTLEVQAYPGNDYFQVNTYDANNPTELNEGGSAHIISTGSISADILSGVDNTINVVTSGVVDNVGVVLDNPAPPVGTPITQNVHVVATDFDSNVIIGNYDQPIGLSDSDSSGTTTLSTTSIPSSATIPTITYDGSGTVQAILSPSINDPVDSSVNFGPHFTSGTELNVGGTAVVPSTSTMFFAHANSPAQTVTLGGTGTVAPYHVDLANCSGGATLNTSTSDGVTFTVAPVSSATCEILWLDANNDLGITMVVVSP